MPGRQELRITVSGAEFSRDARTVFGGPGDIRTMVFPNTVRAVRQGAFHSVKSLKSVVLNEGLETLGTDDGPGAEACCGVFQESGLERVKLPSTLMVIGRQTFMGCERLRRVRLPDGLVEIGLRAFRETGLESIATPESVRIIHQSAFYKCENLRKAVLNEGLEALGVDEHPPKGAAFSSYCGVFARSALEQVELPSTLKRIEYSVFDDCKSLRSIHLPERLEHIGKRCF